MIPKTTEVAHGYTIADLDRFARQACSKDRSMASDMDTRFSAAWSAIAEELVCAEHWPRPEQLVRVGWQAIYEEVREMRHTFGCRDKAGTNRVASSPRFLQFWYRPTAAFEEHLVEKFAITPILATLTETEREAIVALAVHDDYVLAAASLGLKHSTFTVRISNARRRFRTRWFAPDSAPPPKGTDRRVGAHGKPLATHCGNGHEWTLDNTRLDRSTKRRCCRACEHERSQRRTAEKNASRQVQVAA